MDWCVTPIACRPRGPEALWFLTRYPQVPYEIFMLFTAPQIYSFLKHMVFSVLVYPLGAFGRRSYESRWQGRFGGNVRLLTTNFYFCGLHLNV
jgi:hypothetical protein